MSWSYRSEADALAALYVGADVLEAHYPLQTQCPAVVRVGPNSIDAQVALIWPGVVRVTLRYSGELIAQSKPGQPRELDVEATRLAQMARNNRVGYL